MIAIQPVEHLIEALLGGDGHMAVRLFDLIFDPLRHGGMSAMCSFVFGEAARCAVGLGRSLATV